jgi:hypothetical protein
VQQAFTAHARCIAQGGPEYLDAPQWLGLRWPADQHALITLATSWHTDAFYDEALALLSTLAHEPALRDAVELNRAMLRLPFEIDDAELVVEWNVWDVVQAALAGAVVRLEQRPTRYRVERTRPTWLSWDEWLEHVIFCQNQKPTYLYPLVPADTPAPVEAA